MLFLDPPICRNPASGAGGIADGIVSWDDTIILTPPLDEDRH